MEEAISFDFSSRIKPKAKKITFLEVIFYHGPDRPKLTAIGTRPPQLNEDQGGPNESELHIHRFKFQHLRRMSSTQIALNVNGEALVGDLHVAGGEHLVSFPEPQYVSLLSQCFQFINLCCKKQISTWFMFSVFVIVFVCWSFWWIPRIHLFCLKILVIHTPN